MFWSPKNQALEILEESNQQKQTEEQVLTELDNEIECPRCHEVMELLCQTQIPGLLPDIK